VAGERHPSGAQVVGMLARQIFSQIMDRVVEQETALQEIRR